MEKLKILTPKYLEEYSQNLNIDWKKVFLNLQEKDKFTILDFKYMIQSSATYSANIEGNTINPKDYLKIKELGIKSKPKETSEIDDLVLAYNYAKKNKLTTKTFFKTHELLSKTVLTLPRHRGKLRTGRMAVFNEQGIEYVAVESQFVKREFTKLFSDIKLLLKSDLSYRQIFYYASMIHLVFEKIHPFEDGNGRAGRLLEKWFLVEKTNKNAWGIKSEKYYALNKAQYYKNIHIGVDYYDLDMDKCIPFLLMLPKSLNNA